VRKINVSRAGDPVHAGDKALTRETPAKRGRVNRYGYTGWKRIYNPEMAGFKISWFWPSTKSYYI
jgi:hypothetical protein